MSVVPQDEPDHAALARESISQPANPALDRLLDESAVRERLGVGHSTYYQLISDGALRSVKLGRRRFVRETDLNNFIAGLEVRS